MSEQQVGYSAVERSQYDLPFYSRLSIPLNTAIASPQITTLDLPKGESAYIWLEFPKGCAGLVGIALYHATMQIFPKPIGSWYVSDNTTVRFKLREIFDEDEPQISIYAYNLDQVYIHRPWIALEMVARRSAIANSIGAFLSFLGRTE